MGFFGLDKLDDYLLEYGLPTAIGAGTGALFGLPGGPLGVLAGAGVGGATALASAYAGPRVAKALPAGTPKSVRTLAEYGIYGLGAGPGIAGSLAAKAGPKIALKAAFSKSAAREGAKLAATSGFGAVAGGKAAEVAGAPEWLGELLGSIAGPFSPAIGRRLRADFQENRALAFQSESARMKGLARAVGANETNSVRVLRTPLKAVDGKTIYGSSAQSAAAARQQAARLRDITAKSHDQVDDDTVRALTGITSENPRAYLQARVQGHLPPELQEVGPMTLDLRKGERRLATLNKQVLNRRAEDDVAQSTLAELQLKVSGGSTPVGNEPSLIPIEDLQPFLDTEIQSLMQRQRPDAAVANRSITKLKGKGFATESLEDRLQDYRDVKRADFDSVEDYQDARRDAWDEFISGLDDLEVPDVLDAVPPSINQGVSGELVASDKYKAFVWRTADGAETLVPDDVAKAYNAAKQRAADTAGGRSRAEAALKSHLSVDEIPESLDDQKSILRTKVLGPEVAAAVDLDRSKARELAALVRSHDAEQKANYLRLKIPRDAAAQRHDDLAAFLEANPGYGALNPGKMRQASQDYAAILSSERLLTAAGATKRRYLDIPNEGVLTYDDYDKIVHFVVGTAPTPARVAAVAKRFAENPAGSIWLQGAEGTLEPRHLVGVDPRTRQALVRTEFQASDAADAVPLEAVRLRFDPAQQSSLMAEIASAKHLNPTGARGLPRIQIASTRRLWASQRDYDLAVRRAGNKPVPKDGIIEDDMAQAWEQFQANFVPSGNILESKALTPEAFSGEQKAIQSIMSRSPRSGASPVERATFVEFQQQFRTRLQERVDAIEGVGYPVEMRELLEQMGLQMDTDMELPFIMMMRQSDSDIANITKKQITGFGGTVGQFMERSLAGIRVQHPKGRAMLQDFFGSTESSALYVGGTYQAARVALAETLAKRWGGMPTEAIAATKRRGLGGIRDKVHPLSKDAVLTRGLQAEFKPELLSGQLGKQFAALTDDQKAVATPWLGSQLRTLFEHEEAFPGLTNLPEVSAIRGYYHELDRVLARDMQIMGVTPQTHSRRFSMLVDQKYREFLDPDVLNPKGENKRAPTLIDVFNSVWLGAKGDATRVRQALVHGAPADMAHAVAGYQSIAGQRLFEKIKSVAKPGVTITPEDLVIREGQWTIKNLNKWPEELHESLKGIVEVGSGQHKLAGLQQISQQIALGTLAADLSVVGIQGYKYAAQSILAGRPLRAARVLAQGLTHVTTDYGYYSFVRQNLDELMYYAQNGLTGGLRGHISGPALTKAPLENMPLVGPAFSAMYGLSDIQYSRALYYWKVQAVRDNLETVRMLRNARGQVSDKFLADLIETSPMLKTMGQESGGLDGFLLGSTEDTVQQTIRQINRSFGGVNLEAEGVGAIRRAAEQIMTIVPGFFRGQVGQWAAIITKPHTLEGHIALSMLAREYMFGGMIMTGFARLLGTEDRLNWDDPSSPTWLGIPLPESMGGGTINILPTMGLPRLASRVIRETVQAAQGESFDADTALEAFAHGRLSPLVGAFYDQYKGEDFLGRKYESNLEKWTATMSSVVLPIIGQSIYEDVIEEMKRSSATGQFNYKDIALNSGLELFGKGVIPKHPREQLDTLAVSAFGTDWHLLTDAEKAAIRHENPAVAAAEAEFDFYSSRRAGTEETHIDHAYKQYTSDVNRIWFEPTNINGILSSQEDDDMYLAQGVMTGDTWRERYHVRQQGVSSEYTNLVQQLEFEGLNPDKVRDQRLARLKENRPGDRAVLIQTARAEYAAIKPASEPRIVTTPDGEITMEVVDWDAYFDEREAVLNRYPSDIRDAVRRSNKADELPGIAAYQQASQKQREIESLGRYRGLTAEQGDKLDRMRAIVTRVGDAIRGQAGAASGSVPQKYIQRAAISTMARSGVVSTEEDVQLMMLSFIMTKNEKLAEVMRNPAQMSAILANPDVVIFYPYLKYRVPKVLWPRLPQQIFAAELQEAQLAAL